MPAAVACLKPSAIQGAARVKPQGVFAEIPRTLKNTEVCPTLTHTSVTIQETTTEATSKTGKIIKDEVHFGAKKMKITLHEMY